jgi:hypothetical protein
VQPVALGGVIVSVVVSGPKVRAQTLPRRWIFKGDKNPQHDFFGREVKPEAPCRKILRHLKKSLASMNKNTSEDKIFFAPFILLATR